MPSDDLRGARRGRLERLLVAQESIVARRQLTALGIDWDAARANVVAGRWAVRTPRVLSTVTGALTIGQRRWVGVLHAGPGSMLGGLTAAAQHGLTGWERPVVTVLVDDELSYDPTNGIRLFRSRRPFPLMIGSRPGIATARVEPALLLWAGYHASTTRAAEGVLAAAVAQRLTTAQRLYEEVEALRPLRRARHFRAALAVIDAGAHSSAEIDVARMCRLFAMPAPARQTPREERDGRRRRTDCEWDLPDGGTVVLEVEGPGHLDVRVADDDIRRQRRLTVPRWRCVVRCSARELRHEPHEVAIDLVGYGVPGRIPGVAS
ncbi:hypothetical protein [Nocardioides sp. 1609]|uniref:hypothetical protein n=1 Tax=Nocardioides sp. 1609 TaxID=2508327 RepID=UPI00106F9E57|nr:hypothetical protein [Nocardioides sp. 1609]